MPDLALAVSGLVTTVTSAAAPLALMLGGAPPPVAGGSDEEQAFDPNAVTPGTIGFVVTFAMVIIVIFLILDMVKRVRRITFEGRAREAATKATTPPGTTPGASGGAAPGDAPSARAAGSSTTPGRRPGERSGRSTSPPRGLRSLRPPVQGDEPGDALPGAAGEGAPRP